MKRVPRVLVAAGMVLAGVTGGGTPALAAPGAHAPAWCKPHSPVSVAAVPARFAASSCDTAAMTITNGPASVSVPARGLTVSAAVLTTAGTRLLTVAHSADGWVSVQRGLPATTAAPAAPAAASGCASSAFVDLGYQVGGSYNWKYNGKDAPANVAGSALANLKTATSNMASGRDDCGIAGKPRTGQSFTGTTTADPGITSGAGCAPKPDQVNITGWKALTANGVLAVTCTFIFNGSRDVADSDAAINSKFKWVTSSSGCNNAYDLQGVMTHERGHTFGLGHVSGTGDQGLTMYPSIRACDFSKRTLGKGDLLGLFHIYGKA